MNPRAERRAIVLTGIVQGVGLRPFVHRLASRLRLQGFVRNVTGGVRIEIEGEPRSLEEFLTAVSGCPPSLARIEELRWEPCDARGDREFRIESSASGEGRAIFVSPDVATCEECLRELFDPSDRRYRYPFLNCTNCGPRLTIVTGAPYDRPRTTMAPFPMCAACRSEYEDPDDRRYHAQPTACPECGPRLILKDRDGEVVETEDALGHFVKVLQSGGIGALKGLGGYHLACDARKDSVVAELRRRKHRDEKPFALLVRDVATASALCELDPLERELLLSPRRPIVLLAKRPRPEIAIAEAVAPGNPLLGLMLPYTPLHHLLLEAVEGAPLVLTSGNRADEPIASEDEDAVKRLHGIADVFLAHDRAIHVRCDDSVTRIVDGAEQPIRRSRGYAPQPIGMPAPFPEPILAVGGQFKGTFALGRDRHAFVSHHLGDLDHLAAYRAFEKDIALYEKLFDVRPRWIVHDLHPDYASTHYARERAAREGLGLLAVQHHHAHLASCMAENRLTGVVIGVTFDGTGYGTDGTIWGGEILVGGYEGYTRAAHLRCINMPGGEQAIREPWRMAAAHLLDAGCETDSVSSRVPEPSWRTITRMIERGLNTPPTSSAGRLFDAVASILGLRDRVSYEGQAAIELEWLARRGSEDKGYPFELEETADGLIIDTRPLIRAVVEDLQQGSEKTRIARRFHATLADFIFGACDRVRSRTNIHRVVLTGGVFQNALLTSIAAERLGSAGFDVYRHRLVPPNDGGLCLGQLAIARAGRLGPFLKRSLVPWISHAEH